MKRQSRREFLKTAAAGGVAVSLPTMLDAQLPDLLKPNIPPSDRLQIALIGAGGQGMSDTRWALRVPGIELTAVADIYDGRLARAKELWGQQLFTSRDYREVLARPEVDAVIIATPDHWHARIASDAMKAGKDVYVEKPMVQKIDEGLGLADVARQTNRILQVGSQRVSSIIYAKARELYKSGAIGELNMVEAWINRNSALGAWQYTIPPDASPRPSTGSGSWAPRRSGRSSPFACSAGATIVTTAPAFPAICTCTSSRASTTCWIQKGRRA